MLQSSDSIKQYAHIRDNLWRHVVRVWGQLLHTSRTARQRKSIDMIKMAVCNGHVLHWNETRGGSSRVKCQ